MRLCFPNGEHPDRDLDGEELSLGSDPGSDVVLRGAGVAPRHARIQRRAGGLWLELAESVRPAHVNARPVRERALLRAGDVLCLDRLQMVLRDDGADAPGSFPPSAPAADGSDAPASVALRGVAGPHYGRSFSLARSLLIGRGPAAQLRLDGPGIAERQVQVELHGDRVALRVISGTGAEVNGAPASDRLLAPGDQLRIGHHRFVLEAPGLAGARPERGPRGADAIARAGAEAFQAPGTRRESPTDRGVAIWWLIAAASVLAALTTAYLLYGPRIGA